MTPEESANISKLPERERCCCSGSNMASPGIGDCCDGTSLNNEYGEDKVNRHKKERKDLQAQVAKLKHSVPKGDKKKKKDVAEQIAKLEAELEARQNEELENVKTKPEVSPAAIEENTTLSNTEEGIDIDAEGESSIQATGKKSKAQKRRDKKQAMGKDREERIREQEVINRQGPRQQEMQKIKALLKQRGLKLHEIPADGNCLYNSVSHQLSIHNSKSSFDNLRQMAAEYIRSHREDFLPFLTNPDTGDALSPEEFEKYCDKTANSPAWGGQVELRALSEVLHVPIEVLQADASSQVIGENMDGKTLTVVYHRHVYRLGEHYNSVLPADQIDNQQDGLEDGTGHHSIKK